MYKLFFILCELLAVIYFTLNNLITTAQTREVAISNMKYTLDEFVNEEVMTSILCYSQLID